MLYYVFYFCINNDDHDIILNENEIDGLLQVIIMNFKP